MIADSINNLANAVETLGDKMHEEGITLFHINPYSEPFDIRIIKDDNESE